VEQIVAVLKLVELGLTVSDATRQLGISEQTFYRWKRLYGGLQSDQVRELKQLQKENGRLKRVVAELTLDKALLQDVLQKSGPARAEALLGRLSGARSSRKRASGLQVSEAASQ
jgi:putative transposase